MQIKNKLQVISVYTIAKIKQKYFQSNLVAVATIN